MNTTSILKLMKELLVAYGGWAAGGALVARFTDNETSIWRGSFWGMVSAQILSRYVNEKIEKGVIEAYKNKEVPTPVIGYKTNHVEVLNLENNCSKKDKSNLSR